MSKRYGCIGKKLTHSFSREIHAALADYDYQLIELSEEEVGPFLRRGDFAAINVTIPYKQTVIPYLDEISPIASRIGAVNTIVRKNGRLWGTNTDYYGMKALIRRLGAQLKDKKVLILGTGGTSRTARAVAADLGAARILTVSRRKSEGVITYEEAASLHGDARILINTTPCGMYPEVEASPIDLGAFPCLEAVVDAVYNPLRTNLVLDAKERGIPAEGGLYMLVMQAVAAVEHFLDTTIDPQRSEAVFARVLGAKENIVLTGMPGSGKSTVGQLLKVEDFAFLDTDRQIEARCGCPIPELIRREGERVFRDWESRVIAELSAQSGCILSTGGGAVLREENVRALKRNGRIFFLDASLDRLRPGKDRPLSDTEDKLKELYRQRIGIYRSTADVTIPDGASPEEEAAAILEKRKESLL